MADRVRSRLQALCDQVAALLELEKGHIEIHCHGGKVTQLTVIDKSIKFKEASATAN